MLDSLLHPKKEEKDYFCALTISENRIDAALWENDKNDQVKVISTAHAAYEKSWDEAIAAADKAITQIESGLPEGKELQKVVFGLFPNWLTDDKIKDEHLKKLKKLTSDLSLTPLGFVELPQAVAHLLRKDEGTQQTVVLLGLEVSHLTVSIFKIGKQVGSVTQTKTDNVCQDIELALKKFVDVEVLPSRILLFGGGSDLEAVKSELLNYPWQKKASFLHFPKIEILPDDFAVKAVATASASEIFTQNSEVETEESVQSALDQDNPVEKAIAQSAKEDAPETATADEVEAIASDLGFVKNKDIAQNEEETHVAMEQSEDEVENVTQVQQGIPARKRTLPKFTLPSLTFSLKIPRLKRKNIYVFAGVALVILFIGVWMAYWLLPNAKVSLLVSPQTLNTTETITVDTGVTDVDIDNKILPAKEVGVEATGTKSLKTTGKKTIGEKAKGEVTIYNKTLNTKNFSKGTVISAGKLRFTLDGDVSIASASEGVGSLTYGTSKAAVSAVDIGSASNLGPGTEFSFAELPSSSYSARNDSAFAGGSSKEVAVVSKDDQRIVREEALVALTEQAEEELTAKLEAGDKVLSSASTNKVISEVFSAEIGEEADEVSIDLKVAITATTYNEDNMFALLEKVITSSVPEAYEYKKETTEITAEDMVEEDDGKRRFTYRIVSKLFPKVETGDLTRQLAGKPISEATQILKGKGGVAGVEFDVNSILPFLNKRLPANPERITIEIGTL